VAGWPTLEAQVDIANNVVGQNAANTGAGTPTRKMPKFAYTKDEMLVEI
jgi:hypothetical protein